MNDKNEIDKELNRQMEEDPSKFIEYRDLNGNMHKNNDTDVLKQEKSVVKENNQSNYRKESLEEDHKNKKESKHKKLNYYFILGKKDRDLNLNDETKVDQKIKVVGKSVLDHDQDLGQSQLKNTKIKNTRKMKNTKKIIKNITTVAKRLRKYLAKATLTIKNT